jgi:UDP-N-acetylmuramoyl-L-alanyl-D-glutamate--2,6-diaminopimelate ligase
MIYLDDLLKGVDIVSKSGSLHDNVSGIQIDSRKIQPGNCFIAIRGYKENGLNYLGDAIANGATSIVFESKPDETLPDIPINLTWVLVKNARFVLSKMAAAFHGHVSDSMYAVGITGTNGKTTIMSLLHAIYSTELETAKIGTLGMFYDGFQEKATLTTPEATDIFQFLRYAYQKGCKSLVMEVSSVGLSLYRAHAIHFSQGIFTTFSGDHLDFHKTMEDYLKAKMKLFERLGQEDWAVINIDDPSANKILELLNCKYLTYGFSEDADVRPIRYKIKLNGIQATIKTPKGDITIKSSLVGRVNLSNILAAVTSSVIKGISFENITAAIKEFQPVKGRLDPVYQEDFTVIVDYAHTDNALESMLKSLREVVSKRLILVFGAGGSRDKSKRPRMGKAAAENADFLVLTSDNPRQEDPIDIMRDVASGFDAGFKQFIQEPDRQKAIQKAINMAEKDDLVVIAGKGHEDYQIFMDKTIHFDDYEVARETLKRLKKDTKPNA